MKGNAFSKALENILAIMFIPFEQLKKDMDKRNDVTPLLYEVFEGEEGEEVIMDRNARMIMARDMEDCARVLSNMEETVPDIYFIGGKRIEVIAVYIDGKVCVRTDTSDAVLSTFEDVIDFLHTIYIPEVADSFVVTTKSRLSFIEEEPGSRAVFMTGPAAISFMRDYEQSHPGTVCILMPFKTSDPVYDQIAFFAQNLNYEALEEEKAIELEIITGQESPKDHKISKEEQSVRRETDEFGNVRLTF